MVINNAPPHLPHLAAVISDLNPMEHVWDQLKQRLDDCTPTPSDLAELHVTLVEEWNTLPQNNIMGLGKSMRHHC
uniref:Tc1-like transposase DDE domain-containing protein n=1 Tax=Oryzias sinensis TaxID=183150 RepID=A0A8C7YJP9_9TELE